MYRGCASSACWKRWKKFVKSVRVVFVVSGDMYCIVASGIGSTAGQFGLGMLVDSAKAQIGR